MTDVGIAPVLAPILGRIGGNKLTAALDAACSKARTTTRSDCRDANLPHPLRRSAGGNNIIAVGLAAIRFDLCQERIGLSRCNTPPNINQLYIALDKEGT
jgi:hypothetical protein